MLNVVFARNFLVSIQHDTGENLFPTEIEPDEEENTQFPNIFPMNIIFLMACTFSPRNPYVI